MSFSSEVKEELSKLANLANKESVKSEFLGYIITSNVSVLKKKIKYSTENEYNINRFSKLLNNLKITNHSINIIGKSFVIEFPKVDMEEIKCENKIYIDDINLEIFLKKDEVLERSLVRGSFLGSGSINNPNNKYHLEIKLSNIQTAKFILSILEKHSINFKELQKKTNYSIYTKDGEEISKFLAFIGANNAVLKFEDIRVYRDVKNNVNRKVNCETANLNKTITAALKQIEIIKKLKKTGEYDKLPDNVKEVAEIRLKNPEASLQEIGQMLREPIGKSGVNHRLKAIEKLCQ